MKPNCDAADAIARGMYNADATPRHESPTDVSSDCGSRACEGARRGAPDRSRQRRHLPILEWLPRYDRSWLPRNAMAGLTVWALAVPESMAYAGIAGIPLQHGLYAIPLALVAYIIVGSSREVRRKPGRCSYGGSRALIIRSG